MENNKELKEADRIYKLYNKKHNVSMMLGIIFIILLYVFFFMSPSIFHKPSDVEYTNLGQKVSLGDERVIEIEFWKYSPNQNLMEVQLNVENNAYDGNDYYNYTSFVNFQAESKGKEQLPIEIKLQQINFVVLWIHDVPQDYNSCSLNVYMKNDESVYASVFTNYEKVKKVNKIKSMTETDYQIEKIKRDIKALKKQINKNNNKIVKINKEISNIEKHINELKKNEIYQSESEIEISEDQIDSYNSQIEERNSRIALLQESNADNRAKIIEYRELKEKISSGKN